MLTLFFLLITGKKSLLSPLSDSTSTRDSMLSPAELLSFQGCVIPPVTPPQRVFSPEENAVHSSTETDNFHAQDEASWRAMAECHERALGHSVTINKQVKHYIKPLFVDFKATERLNQA